MMDVREIFEEIAFGNLDKIGSSSKRISHDKWLQRVNCLIEWQSSPDPIHFLNEHPFTHQLVKRGYSVQEENGKKHLYKEKKNRDGLLIKRKCISMEQTYDLIREMHIKLNHASSRKMKKELDNEYYNVTLHECQVFCQLCSKCVDEINNMTNRNKQSKTNETDCKSNKKQKTTQSTIPFFNRETSMISNWIHTVFEKWVGSIRPPCDLISVEHIFAAKSSSLFGICVFAIHCRIGNFNKFIR